MRDSNAPALVRRLEKRLPYSITPIGGPDQIQAWRALQEEKAEQSAINAIARKQRIVRDMNSGKLLDKMFPKSGTTKIFERHAAYVQRCEAWAVKAHEGILRKGVLPDRFPEKPFLNRLLDQVFHFLFSPFSRK